jgi:hypothetical protein
VRAVEVELDGTPLVTEYVIIVMSLNMPETVPMHVVVVVQPVVVVVQAMPESGMLESADASGVGIGYVTVPPPGGGQVALAVPPAAMVFVSV